MLYTIIYCQLRQEIFYLMCNMLMLKIMTKHVRAHPRPLAVLKPFVYVVFVFASLRWTAWHKSNYERVFLFQKATSSICICTFLNGVFEATSILSPMFCGKNMKPLDLRFRENLYFTCVHWITLLQDLSWFRWLVALLFQTNKCKTQQDKHLIGKSS